MNRLSHFYLLRRSVKFPNNPIGCFSYRTFFSKEACNLDSEDIGNLYSVPMEQIQSLHFDKFYLPKNFKTQMQTFHQCVWIFRRQTFKAFQSLRQLEPGQTAPRLVLWGKYGTGKSITLYQLAHLAYTQDYLLLTIPDAMSWSNDNYHEVQVSSFKPGRVDSPYWANKMLKMFKLQNKHKWDQLTKLKTLKKYEWSQVEKTEKGKSITEIVEMGLTAPYLATDCVGALYKELRVHATSGAIKLLVLIDKANGLYGKSVVKKAGRVPVAVDELTLTIQVRKFLLPIWSNGLCAMVADKAGISDSRDSLAVPVNEPENLFGQEGIEQIKPFISVETQLYSKEEINTMYEYYLEKDWIRQKEGPAGEEAKKQLIHMSAFNPAYFERLCSIFWNLDCVVPVINADIQKQAY